MDTRSTLNRTRLMATVFNIEMVLKSNTVKKSNLGYSRTLILKQKTNVDGCSDRIRLIPKLTLMLLLQLGNRGQLGLGKLCSMPV